MIVFYFVFMSTVILGVFAVLAFWLWSRIQPMRQRKIRSRLEHIRGRITAVHTLIPAERNIAYSEFPVIEASASIEAWLLQNQPKNALIAAMHAVKGEPENGNAYLHLARTLLYCNEIEGARKALQRARSLGRSGAAADFLEARIKLQDAGILKETGMLKTSDETLAILERLVDTVEQDPNFGDAAYHLGRLALAMGLKEEGRLLLEKVKPLMEASPERSGFTMDLSRLN